MNNKAVVVEAEEEDEKEAGDRRAEYLSHLYEYPLTQGTVCMHDGLTMRSTPDKIKQFPFHADDVLIASHPKAGTHWVSEIVYLLAHGGDTSLIQQDLLYRRVDMLELTSFYDGQVGVDIAWDKHPPRYMFSHMFEEFYASDFTKPVEEQARKIVVYRNPKDALVSFHHFYETHPVIRYKMNWTEFFDLYQSNKLLFGDFVSWIAAWRHHRNNPRVLFVSYDQLKADHEQGVRAIASFLGNDDVTDDVIKRVVDATTFQAMSASGTCSYAMRKGEVGGWRDVFTEEQSEYVDSMVAAELGGMGISFCE